MDTWDGRGTVFCFFFTSKKFFFLYDTSVCFPYVGSVVFYCMSLFGGWTATFHCNLMNMVQTTSSGHPLFFSRCLLPPGTFGLG